MTTGALLLLCSLFLGMGVFENGGLFSVFALLWMTLGFVSILLATLGYLRKIRIPIAPPDELMLVCALLFFLYIRMFQLPNAFLSENSNFALVFYATYCLLIVLLCCAFFFVPRAHALKWVTLGIGLVIALVLRVWLLPASPAPKIDVFSAATYAMQHFFSNGKSPYLPDDSGIIPFYYPPSNVYLQALSYGIFHDIRAIYVACEAVFAGLLWHAGRRSMGSIGAGLLALLFLFQPFSITVLEMGWTEPPILTFLALSLFFFGRGKRTGAAIAYGYAISLKQYLLFFLMHWFLLEKKPKRFAIMLIAAVATVVPFLFFDPGNMIHYGFVQTLTGGDVRTDSLTFVTLLFLTTGVVLPRITSVLIGAVASAATFFAFRKSSPIPAFLFSSALTTFALFLFGAQAFTNYYYIVSGLVLMGIAWQGEETA